MEPQTSKIEPTEVPVYMEFIWLAIVAILPMLLSPDHINELAKITTERCREFGTSEEDLESFYTKITDITGSLRENGNARADN